MKRLLIFFAPFLLVSCATTKQPEISQPLYDILAHSDFGGANFQFYEIISEPDEFKVLLSDDILKKYVKKEDIETSNYILVNIGEKPTNGYEIRVQKVKELADKIVVTIKVIEPKHNVNDQITKPYCVVKIKSKKPIEIN